MTRFAHVLSLAALLAALPAAAAEGDVSHYLAQGLEASGSAGAIGPLAVALVRGNGGEQEDATAALTLAITAERVGVESDRRYDEQDGLVMDPVDTVQGDDGAVWTMEPDQFADARVDLAAARRAYRVFIEPVDAEAEVRAPAFAMTVDSGGPVQEPRMTQHPDRPLAEADVAGSFEVTSSGRTWLRVTGDFLVMLWDVNVTVGDAQRKVLFWSGEVNNQTADTTAVYGQALDVHGTSVSRKTYLHVENGTLDLVVDDGKWEALNLHATGAAAAGFIRLQGAIQQDVDVQASSPDDVSIPGPVACQLAAAGGRFDAWFLPAAESPPEGAPLVDALELLPLSGEGNAPSTAVSWQDAPAWIGAFLAALALAAVGVAAFRRLSQSRAMRSLRGHMETGDYAAAAKGVDGLLGSRRHRREAAVIGIVAALRAGDLPRARDLLERSHASLAEDPALEPFLEACLAAASHEDERARALLADSLRLDGSLAEHARANPLLARVHQQGPQGPQDPSYT